MAKTCRLCGKSEIHAISIFGNEALEHHIDLKIRVGLDIQIFPDDPLPKYACVCCLGKLDEFWTFLHHCRKVQTNLRRLLNERVSIQFHDIIRDELQKSKTSTENSSPHIEVLETLGDSTGNDVNDSGCMNPNNNSKVELDKVNVDTHCNENSKDSFHSYNELCGNECEPFESDPHFIDRDLLVTTQNGISLAAGQLDSYCQGREESMVFSAAGFTSQSAPEYNPVTVETESEVQANRASKKTDLINTVHGRSETTLSAKNNNADFQSISDRRQDPLLMEELTLELPKTVLTTTSILTVAVKGSEDERSNDTFSVNNDLNQNRLQAPNMFAQSSHYVTSANKGRHSNQMTNTCRFLDNNSQPSSLMEEQPSKNRNHGTDGTQVISTVVVNIISNNEKEVDCDSVFNPLWNPLMKGEVACKTTGPAIGTCSQNISVHEVNDEEVPQGDGGDFSQDSVIITGLPLNHPNHVGSGMANVSSGIEASSDDNPRYLLGKVCNTIPQITGKLSRDTEFVLNGLSINGDCQPLRVVHSDADIADMSDQNMKTSGRVSDSIGTFPVTIENEVHQTQQLNTASCTDSNTNHESKGHSIVVNSGNSAICVHGIDATVCIYTKCCDSHQFDKHWIKEGALFHCLLCEHFTHDKYKIRAHVCAHIPLKLFECSICYKKFRLFQKLSLHIKTHSRKVDGSSAKKACGYSCENCSKIFKTNAYLQYHQKTMCEISSVSSREKHKFRCSAMTGFVCDFCNKSYKVKKYLKRHLRRHEQGEYACDKCEKMYSTSTSLYQHQKSKHETPRFKCTYCPSSFYFKSFFEKHIVAHTGTRNYEESQPLEVIHSDADIAGLSDQNMGTCGKESDLKDSVAVTKICGVYKCENCSETFNLKAKLRRHQIKACMIGTSSCPDCGLHFLSLKRHRFRCPGKTGFVCDICNRSFNRKDSLISHLRSHEQGEYACDKCEKIFSNSRVLQYHQRNKHETGEFKCTYCTKSFCMKTLLDLHIVTHTGIRNYLCEICSKSFLYASNLFTHMKFHGKRDIKCYLCGKMYFRKNMLLSHMKNVHCK